jgi:hypothetical protein
MTMGKTPATTSRMTSAPRLPEGDLELASRLLDHRTVSRPVSTLAWAVAAGLASMPLETQGHPSGLATMKMDLQVWRDALFNDWHLDMDPWDKPTESAAVALLQRLVNHSRALLPPLPAYPKRPTLTGAVLDKLWAHLDFAAWRTVRFLDDPALEPCVDQSKAVMAKIQDGVALLEQFGLMMVKAFTDQGSSARDYTEELAEILLRLHQTLDAAAVKAGHDPLGWPIPDYRPFLAPPLALPPGPRGTHLPEPLAGEFQRALASRACPRPLRSLGDLFGWYGALKEALDPGWTWSPARDGRECAFIVFESTLEELPPWTQDQARELSRLCTAAYTWFKDQPLPPLPSLPLDPQDAEGTALWLHQDLLFFAGSVLGVELGILPSPGDDGALKRARRLRDDWSEIQALVWGATFHWPETPLEERALLAHSLSLALSAVYQGLRNEIAKVDRHFLRFVPKPPEALLPMARKAMVRFGRIKKR